MAFLDWLFGKKKLKPPPSKPKTREEILIERMPDEAGFMRGLLTDPDDTPLRLVYADYLEDREDSRSEVLRLECEAASSLQGSPQRRELADRLEKLLGTVDPDWFAVVVRGSTLKTTPVSESAESDWSSSDSGTTSDSESTSVSDDHYRRQQEELDEWYRRNGGTGKGGW